MIKTIALAALGTFVAATPALAGPGIVFQGRSLNGIATHGIVAAAPTPLAVSATPAATPIVVQPVATPVQTACSRGCGGIKFNGIKLNGLTFNGLTFNGRFLNGRFLNGKFLNGKLFNGRLLNGRLLNGTAVGTIAETPDAGFAVTAVTLASGERLTIAG